MDRQYLASFPYDPLACLCVAVYYGNLLVWKIQEICCWETQKSVWAVPLSR